MKATFLYLLLNEVTRNFKKSIVGIFIMYIKKNVYDVDDNIATKSEVNQWMLSTLENAKSILIVKIGETLKHQWLNLWVF